MAPGSVIKIKKPQMLGFTSWVWALIPKTSCEPVAGGGLWNLVHRGEGKAEGGGRGKSLLGFID